MSNSVSYTGHRPNALNGYSEQDNRKLIWELYRVSVDHIENKNCTTFISGVCIGVDFYASKIVIKLKEKYPQIKLISAVPCRNQSKMWPKKSQDEWQYIIDNSDEVVLVTDEDYTPKLMQIRNDWMLDNSDYLIAVYNGSGSGGTANCVKSAIKKNKQITYINPKDYE